MVTKFLQQLKELYQQYFALKNVQTPQSKKLYEVTMANLDKDMSPRENELGCAETVNTLAELAWNEEVGGNLSTYRMYDVLFLSPKYVRVTTPLPGDIVISPTGYGNGRIKNGHVGVVCDNGLIASNDSYTYKLALNYNIKSWRERYVNVGGFPMQFYRRII